MSQQTLKRYFNISVFVSRERHHRYPLRGRTEGTVTGLSVGEEEAPFRVEPLELVASHFTNRTIPATL
jgi:hypothetical protein